VESYKENKNPQQSTLITTLRLPDGKWARSGREKANRFAEYLPRVFTLFSQETVDDEEEKEKHYRYIIWKYLCK